MRKISATLEEVVKEPWNFPACALYLSKTTFEELRDECKPIHDAASQFNDSLPPFQLWAVAGIPLVLDDAVPDGSYELRKGPNDVPIQRGTVFAPNDSESE